MYRRCSAHSSVSPMSSDPTRRLMAARSGTIPTPSVRRRIFVCKRSLRVGARDLAPELASGSAARQADPRGPLRGVKQPRAAWLRAPRPLVGTEPPPRGRQAHRRWYAPGSQLEGCLRRGHRGEQIPQARGSEHRHQVDPASASESPRVPCTRNEVCTEPGAIQKRVEKRSGDRFRGDRQSWFQGARRSTTRDDDLPLSAAR